MKRHRAPILAAALSVVLVLGLLAALVLYNDAEPVAWMYNLGHVYGFSGKSEQAKSTLGKMLKLGSDRYVNPYFVGIVHLGMGETDRSFEWFEKAYQDRSEELLFLKVDPRLDGIRSDARYKSLVRRLRLPL